MMNFRAKRGVTKTPSLGAKSLFRVSLFGILATASACGSVPDFADALEGSPLTSIGREDRVPIDRRSRFREILCAVNAARGKQFPVYRPCEDIIHRFPDEPVGAGAPVNLGPPRTQFRIVVVPGLGADCVAGLVTPFRYALENLRDQGFAATSIEVDGLSSSENNARQIREAVAELDLKPEERLVLLGYSKGTTDVLEGLVAYPELAERVAAVISISGAIKGSPLAEGASQSRLALLQYLPGATCDAGDGGALESLKPAKRRQFAETHELPKNLRYFSLGTFAHRDQVSSLMRGSYDRLASEDPRNDGEMLFFDQVIVEGALLGFARADHWAVALPFSRQQRLLAATLIDRNEFPREVLLEAVVRQVDEDLSLAKTDRAPLR